jgi:hypothetical protein
MQNHQWRYLSSVTQDIADDMASRNKQPIAADIEAGTNQTPAAAKIVRQQWEGMPDRIR